MPPAWPRLALNRATSPPTSLEPRLGHPLDQRRIAEHVQVEDYHAAVSLALRETHAPLQSSRVVHSPLFTREVAVGGSAVSTNVSTIGKRGEARSNGAPGGTRTPISAVESGGIGSTSPEIQRSSLNATTLVLVRLPTVVGKAWADGASAIHKNTDASFHNYMKPASMGR